MSRTAKKGATAEIDVEMTTLACHRASPIGSQVIAPLTIVLAAAFPDLPTDEGRALHLRDAQHLASALSSTLPGGTLDRLTAELLARQATLLRIPHTFPNGPYAECVGLLRWLHAKGGLGPEVHERIAAALIAAEGRTL